MTRQERNRTRTARAEKAARTRTLWICGLTYAERDHLRARVPYTAASDTHIATSGEWLALAVMELSKLRRRKKVTVRMASNGFELTAKLKKARCR